MQDSGHEEAGAPDAKQAFPKADSLTVSAERVSLESLVHHCEAVPHDMPLEEVEKVFREKGVDFLAILRGDRVLGLCARVRMGALLGSRYGFALYSRMPATLAQVDHPLVVSTSDPIRQVLYLALARGTGEFHEDVALVDASHKLLGLVSVEALAQLQSRLVGEQLDQMKHQSEVLQRQNLDLFQAGHAQRQAQGLYQGLFESNALGVALLGSHGTVQAHNRRLVELLNLSDEGTVVTSLDGWMDEADRVKFQRFLATHERSVH